jgi:hypothetical protein
MQPDTQLVPELSKPHHVPGVPWLPKRDPWMPPDRDDQVIWASLAFSQGKATEGQQRLLWNWLMYSTGASDEYADLSFRPGEEGRRATDFAEGKRFVGLQLKSNLHPIRRPKGKQTIIESDNPALPAKKKRGKGKGKRGKR